MKHLLTYIMLLAMLSCSKERSCENCASTGVPVPPGNKPPVAIASVDSTNRPAGTRLLSAKGSTDPDGTIVSYLWKKVAGPSSFNIVDPSKDETLVSNLTPGRYEFELTVKDNGGLASKDTVIFTISLSPSNSTVFADAGPDQTITLPLDSTYLDGSRSMPNGFTTSTPAIFVWNCIKGPRQYVLNLSNLTPPLNQTTVSANGLVQGVYWYELRVTVPGGASDVDTIQVTVINDPLLKNTVTYHDLVWTEGDPGGLGNLTTFISSSVKPDLFTRTGAIKPIEISLRSANAPFTVVPYKANTAFTWDAALYNAWIMTVPNNPLLVGKKADMRIRFL